MLLSDEEHDELRTTFPRTSDNLLGSCAESRAVSRNRPTTDPRRWDPSFWMIANGDSKPRVCCQPSLGASVWFADACHLDSRAVILLL